MKMVNVIRLLAVFASFFLSLNLFAQEQCGTDDMIIRNPFLMSAYNNRVACEAPEIDLDTAQVLTIPVVMHILHLGEGVGEGTNISDEQVLSCIRNLNERFRADTAAMAVYTDYYDNVVYDVEELSLAIDSKIEFCLATRDPNNLPTTGINRYDCSTLTYVNNFSGQTSTAYYPEQGISNGSQYDIPLTGNSYQGMSGKQRRHITINGSKTVEMDYSSLHIAMLYAEEGIQLKEKPYNCFGEEYKGLFKKLLLTAINAKSPVQCVKSIKKNHAELRVKPFLKEKEFKLLHSIEQLKPNWYDLLDELKQKHSQIAKYFCSDKGVELQRKDSEIMLNIIHKLAKHETPAL